MDHGKGTNKTVTATYYSHTVHANEERKIKQNSYHFHKDYWYNDLLSGSDPLWNLQRIGMKIHLWYQYNCLRLNK